VVTGSHQVLIIGLCKKRHLIAHGLAHHLFHRDVRVNYFLDERDYRFNYWRQRRQEKEAEVFAAYLLIPEDKLNEKLRKNGSGSLQTQPQSWQKNSKVSENFMRKRLKFKGNLSMIET